MIKRLSNVYVDGQLFSGLSVHGQLYPNPVIELFEGGFSLDGDRYLYRSFTQTPAMIAEILKQPSGGGGGESNVKYYIGDLTVISPDTYSLTDVYNTTGRTATMIDNTGDIGVILDGTFNPNYMATASLVSTNAKANFCYAVVPFSYEVIGIGVSNFEFSTDAARIFITIFE